MPMNEWINELSQGYSFIHPISGVHISRNNTLEANKIKTLNYFKENVELYSN